MHSRKKDEAPTTCDSQGLLSNKSSVGNIDMNIVAKSDYNFQGIDLVPAPVNDGIWLTSSDIAKALGYASPKAYPTFIREIQMNLHPVCLGSSK